MDYADHPPKPQMVLPCLLRAQTTSMAVTVFLLACSVQVTASLTMPSRNPLRTCLESSQMNEEILLTPPLRASLRMAGLVMPSIEALACLFWAVLLVPTLPLPPTPFPPLPCPAIFLNQILINFASPFQTQIAQYPKLSILKSDWLLYFQSDYSDPKQYLKLHPPNPHSLPSIFSHRDPSEYPTLALIPPPPPSHRQTTAQQPNGRPFRLIAWGGVGLCVLGGRGWLSGVEFCLSFQAILQTQQANQKINIIGHGPASFTSRAGDDG